MSLIVTHISKFGIIQIADSALTQTAPSLADAGNGQKLFEVPHLNAVLVIAGSYAVGNTPLDDWLTNFINLSAPLGTLGDFAKELGTALTRQIQATQAHIIHLAGYANDSASGFIPELWHIRNIQGIDQVTGSYVGVSNTYAVTEDFRARDLSAIGAWADFQSRDVEQLYVNGPVNGRIGFNAGYQSLAELDAYLIANSAGELRRPASLDEMESRVVKRFELVSDIYSRNTHGARVIGGPTQVKSIPLP